MNAGFVMRVIKASGTSAQVLWLLLLGCCLIVFVMLFAVHIREASNISVNLQDFSVQFRDVNNLPPQQTLGVKLLT